jgi:hypothetical protein
MDGFTHAQRPIFRSTDKVGVKMPALHDLGMPYGMNLLSVVNRTIQRATAHPGRCCGFLGANPVRLTLLRGDVGHIPDSCSRFDARVGY